MHSSFANNALSLVYLRRTVFTQNLTINVPEFEQLLPSCVVLHHSTPFQPDGSADCLLLQGNMLSYFVYESCRPRIPNVL